MIQPDDPGPRYGGAYLTALMESSHGDLIDEAMRQKDRAERAEARLHWMGVALIATLLIFGVATMKARAETVDGSRITIMDGDTVALPCARPAPGCAERVRILNIDAPESFRPSCDREGERGLAAKARLATLLRGQPVEVTRCEVPETPATTPHTSRCFDRYGRTLARLAITAGDVGQILIAEGHALPWAPGPEAKLNRQKAWCAK